MTTSFIAALEQGKPLLGAFVSLNTIYAAQIMARSGFNWLLIDMEHSPLSAHTANDLVHATITASQGSCVPIIRVPSHRVEWINWALDSGVSAVIVPMVNSKEDADMIVKRACYPPLGQRSSGPFKTPFADLEEKTTSFTKYVVKKSKDVIIMAMIESVEGLENVEAIMTTKGSDGDETMYLDGLKKIVGIAKRMNIPVGILGSQDNLARQFDMGFDYFLLGGDAALLVQGAEMVLEKAKANLKQAF